MHALFVPGHREKGKVEMSKYDFEVDLSQNSSTGMLLSKIPAGASVLEFGCAAGRMTRYMKEDLGCQVCIVEYDRGAYEKALEYAQDGLCDDIMNFSWAEKFADRKFDIILFADVLEHLTAPEQVLSRAAEFLKDNGLICASVPNITHNDILLKASQERFDYMSTGILDDTHVHFWGMENLKELADRSGLHLARVEGTWCRTGDSEQAVEDPEQSILLANILRKRQCGEAYQFVLTFEKNGTGATEYCFREPAIQSCIYMNTGSGFNPREFIMVESEYSGQGIYRLRHVLRDTENLCAVRFDPVEDQGCIVRKCSITQGRKELPLLFSDGPEMTEGRLLAGKDPSVCASVQPGGEPVVIEAEFILSGEEYLERLEREYLSIVAPEGVDHPANEKEQLARDVSAYMCLTNKKEEDVIRLEQENESLRSQRDSYWASLEYYRNLRVVRLRAFAVRVARGVLRRVKRVLGRGEHR